MRTTIVLLAGWLGLALAVQAQSAGNGTTPTTSAPGVTAFVHVNLVPLDREVVLPDWAVIVRGGRIVATGPAAEVAAPDGAEVIDGTGKFLLPGLVDAHMHVDPLVGARPDFGDAPIYLAYGVTTVYNLRGLPMHLDWQKRIHAGALLAPNLYNSGEFVQEPRVRTPAEAEREVAAQVRAGYDMIKLHQVYDEKQHRVTTTTWMDLDAYLAVNAAAHRTGIPILGHGPYNLGLEPVLQARQSLAHIGEFHPLHFFPVQRTGEYALATLTGLLGLMVVLAAWGAAGGWRRLRRWPAPDRPLALQRVRRLAGGALLLAIVSLAAWVALIPGGPLCGNVPLLTGFTVLGLGLAAAAAAMIFHLMRTWREPAAALPARFGATVATLAVVALAVTLTYWIPLAWRCRDAAVEQLARDCKRSGIWVQSTLVLYDKLIDLSISGAESITATPAFRSLDPAVQKEWRDAGAPLPPWMATLMGDYPVFTRKIAAALHREGVPIMAGTDAMGVPMMPPGVSLHWELRLLTTSGFTPYEALRAATVRPAEYLGRQGEFGTATVGKRADLLLVDGNPLQDLACLERPRGVMVRGTWLPEAKLQQLLAGLTTNQ